MTIRTWEVVTVAALTVLLALAYSTARSAANMLRRKLVETAIGKHDIPYKMVQLGDEHNAETSPQDTEN